MIDDDDLHLTKRGVLDYNCNVKDGALARGPTTGGEFMDVPDSGPTGDAE